MHAEVRATFRAIGAAGAVGLAASIFVPPGRIWICVAVAAGLAIWAVASFARRVKLSLRYSVGAALGAGLIAASAALLPPAAAVFLAVALLGWAGFGIGPRPEPRFLTRLCRAAVVLVLVLYTAAFIHWNLQNHAPAALCCHDAELSLNGLNWADRATLRSVQVPVRWPARPYTGAGWLRLTPGHELLRATLLGSSAVDGRLQSSLLTDLAQGAWFVATDFRPWFPLLPAFLPYLLALAAIYLIGERLVSGVAGLLGVGLGLTTELFIYQPTSAKGLEGPTTCLLLVAVALIILLPRRWHRAGWSLLIGCLFAAAYLVGQYWASISVAGGALLLLGHGAGPWTPDRRPLRPSPGRPGSRWISLLLIAAPTVVLVLVLDGHLDFWMGLLTGEWTADRLSVSIHGRGPAVMWRELGASLHRHHFWPSVWWPGPGVQAANTVALLGIAALSTPLDRSSSRPSFGSWLPITLVVGSLLLMAPMFKSGGKQVPLLGWLCLAGGIGVGRMVERFVASDRLRMALVVVFLIAVGVGFQIRLTAARTGAPPYDGTASSWYGVKSLGLSVASEWRNVRTGCSSEQCARLYSAIASAIRVVQQDRRVWETPHNIVCTVGLHSGFPAKVLGRRQNVVRHIWLRERLSYRLCLRSQQGSCTPGVRVRHLSDRSFMSWRRDATLLSEKRLRRCRWMMVVRKRGLTSASAAEVSAEPLHVAGLPEPPRVAIVKGKAPRGAVTAMRDWERLSAATAALVLRRPLSRRLIFELWRGAGKKKRKRKRPPPRKPPPQEPPPKEPDPHMAPTLSPGGEPWPVQTRRR